MCSLGATVLVEPCESRVVPVAVKVTSQKPELNTLGNITLLKGLSNIQNLHMVFGFQKSNSSLTSLVLNQMIILIPVKHIGTSTQSQFVDKVVLYRGTF